MSLIQSAFKRILRYVEAINNYETTKSLLCSTEKELGLVRQQYLDSINTRAFLVEDNDILQANYDQLHDAYVELLPKKTLLDNWLEDRYQKISPIAYKDKRAFKGENYSVYLHELITPEAYEVKKFISRINLDVDSIEVIARKVGNKIAKTLKWTSDDQFDYDQYVRPSESIVHKNVDCEDHTFLAMSCHEEIGGAWGFYKGGGHAFNVFIHEQELYILETTSNYGKVIKYKDQEDYEIYFIITRSGYYRVKAGVVFGKIADRIKKKS